jgi:hypothetical protein
MTTHKKINVQAKSRRGMSADIFLEEITMSESYDDKILEFEANLLFSVLHEILPAVTFHRLAMLMARVSKGELP